MVFFFSRPDYLVMFLFPYFRYVCFIQSDVSQLENRWTLSYRLSLFECVGLVILCETLQFFLFFSEIYLSV